MFIGLLRSVCSAVCYTLLSVTVDRAVTGVSLSVVVHLVVIVHRAVTFGVVVHVTVIVYRAVTVVTWLSVIAHRAVKVVISALC